MIPEGQAQIRLNFTDIRECCRTINCPVIYGGVLKLPFSIGFSLIYLCGLQSPTCSRGIALPKVVAMYNKNLFMKQPNESVIICSISVISVQCFFLLQNIFLKYFFNHLRTTNEKVLNISFYNIF